jgi:hypothetical protein
MERYTAKTIQIQLNLGSRIYFVPGGCSSPEMFVNWNFFAPMVSYLIIYIKETTKHNEIQEKARRIRAGMCTERKLHSNWCSPADTPSLSPTVAAGLRVRYLRHRSSPDTFFVWKICSWTDLFVMRGVHEPRFHCTTSLIFLCVKFHVASMKVSFYPRCSYHIKGLSRPALEAVIVIA